MKILRALAGIVAVWLALLAPSAPALAQGQGPAVIHPSSGNLVGDGCTSAHQLWWVDHNPCMTGDVFNWVSSDPSALASITVTGTTGTGSIVLTYTFGAGACASGCATTINTTSGQSTSTVATNIVTALKANASLYNNVAGAQGQLLFLTTAANIVDYDYNVTVSTQVKYTCTSCGLTLTFGAGQSTVATNYTLPTALDNNPVVSVARNSGLAPAAGSQLFTINSQGTTSTSPAAIAVSYGVIQNRVVNSTTGSIAGSWVFALPGVDGSLSKGLTLTASALTPAADNSVALGSGILNYSEVFAYAFSVPGISSGAGLIVAQAAAGNPTLLLPNTSGTFAVNASAPLSLSATTGALTCSTCLTLSRHIIPLSNGTVSQAQNVAAFQVTANNANETLVQVLSPFAGTFKNLYVQSTAPASGQTLTATLRVNNSDTAVTCVITGPATTCNDTTHTAAVTAGQTYSLKLTTSATSGTLSALSAGVEFDNP